MTIEYRLIKKAKDKEQAAQEPTWEQEQKRKIQEEQERVHSLYRLGKGQMSVTRTGKMSNPT